MKAVTGALTNPITPKMKVIRDVIHSLAADSDAEEKQDLNCTIPTLPNPVPANDCKLLAMTNFKSSSMGTPPLQHAVQKQISYRKQSLSGIAYDASSGFPHQ